MKRLQAILPLLSIGCVAYWRGYGLSRIGLPAYDVVQNYEVIKEIAEGNFKHLFGHLCPTFYLVYTPFYKLFPSFLSLEYLTIAISLIAIWRLVALFSLYFPLNFWQKSLLLLLLGSSPMLTDEARSLAIESMSLLLFVEWLKSYLVTFDASQQHISPSSKNWLISWAWFAMLLTVSYKALLLLPVVMVLEWTFRNKLFSWWQWGKVASILALPQVFYLVLGLLLGIGWKPFLGTWYFKLIRPVGTNPWAEIPIFNFDFLFYFRYLLDFESFLLLPGVLLLLISVRGKFSKQSVLAILFLFVGLVIAGMSVLAKAPRGLTFIYPLLYGLAFVGLNKKVLNPYLFSGIILLGIGHNLYRINQHIYAYTTTNYPQIASYLRHHHIQKIAVTVGINVKPFLDDSTELTIIRFEKDLDTLRAKGYEYSLIDDYHRIAGANVFEHLRLQKPLLALPEPTLLPPILYLEHCEFNSLSYQEALLLQQKVAKEPSQLQLIRIPANGN